MLRVSDLLCLLVPLCTDLWQVSYELSGLWVVMFTSFVFRKVYRHLCDIAEGDQAGRNLAEISVGDLLWRGARME
jgi:hypothetical protein